MDAKPGQYSKLRSSSAPSLTHLEPDSNDFPLIQLVLVGPCSLTINSILDINGSIKNPWTIASTLGLILLLWCALVIKRTPSASPKRRSLKVVLWLLSTVLIVMYSIRVTAAKPATFVAVMWGLFGISIAANFYALVDCRGERSCMDGSGDDSNV